jgi:hypothetical protein
VVGLSQSRPISFGTSERMSEDGRAIGRGELKSMHYEEEQCLLGPFSVLAQGDSVETDGTTGLPSGSGWTLSRLAGSDHRRRMGCRLKSIRHTRSTANNATVTRSGYRLSPLWPC